MNKKVNMYDFHPFVRSFLTIFVIIGWILVSVFLFALGILLGMLSGAKDGFFEMLESVSTFEWKLAFKALNPFYKGKSQ